jgi:hypothetical protein
MPASLVPSVAPINGDIHLVLCDFGKRGQAFVETDITASSRQEIVRRLIDGQYVRPLRVVALNLENWSRDVSEEVALEVARTAEREGCSFTRDTREFIDAHLDSMAVDSRSRWADRSSTRRA